MAPSIPHADLALKYPVYASAFDPHNNNYLFVAGGGGEGRSGVENTITCIDTSHSTKLHEVQDITLSRDEDSVTSLAVARSSQNDATVLAGINSSSKELAKGVNEHLRSFRFTYPPSARADELDDEKSEQIRQASTTPPKFLGKTALFEDPVGKQETYQRVLRVSSPLESGASLAAIATGSAPFGEIVVFDASKEQPTTEDVRQKIKLQKGEEAADLDLIAGKNGNLELVYCTDYDVCICTVSPTGKAKAAKPTTLYTTPQPSGSAPKKRPTFRAVRFLSAHLLALIQNLPGRSGTEVLLMNVPGERSQGSNVLLRKRLDRSVKSATSLATAFLPAASKDQNVQHVLAIAGQNISITILTLDRPPDSKSSFKLKTHAFLKDVHDVQMTSLAFSHFVPPKDSAKAGPQYLKLASTSMGASVVVHRLPLRIYPPLDEGASRYCLSFPGGRAEVGQISISILITIIMAAIGGVLIQSLLEIRGGSPDYLGAKNLLSDYWRERIAVPYMFAEAPVLVSSMPPVESVQSRIYKAAQSVQSPMPNVEEFVAPMPEPIKQAILNHHSPETDSKPLILRDTESGVEAENHHDEAHLASQGRKWEDLEHHERKEWKKKLVSAGKWTEGQLETLFKGVLFGELGAAVAGAMG